MVPAYFVILVILVACLYNIYTGNNQFQNTASVIRQIWSGRCRSCAQATNSRYSGLSGDTDPSSNVVGTSHDTNCICDSCPCEIVEDLMRKCTPVSGVLQDCIVVVLSLFVRIIRVFEDVYDEFARATQCRGTCQRQGQVSEIDSNETTPRIASATNNRRSSEKVPEDFCQIEPEEPSHRKDYKNLNNQDKTPTKIVEDEPKRQEPKSAMKSIILEKTKSASSEQALKPTDSAAAGNCTKCKQKNRHCVTECPRSPK